MSSTITLGQSINFSQAFGGFRQLTIGTANEPAVTAANIVLTTILSPPFCWNWNRSGVYFVALTGTQDNAVSIPTFGFIEKASYLPAVQVTATSLTANVATYTAANTFSTGDLVTVKLTTNGSGVFNVTRQPIASASATQFTVAITNANVSSAAENGAAVDANVKQVEISNVQNVLSVGNDSGAPNFIAPQMDDNAGNITFRLLPVPDQTYLIHVTFQKKIPALMSGTSSLWAPVPDHYSNIYQWGFLSVVAAYFGSEMWQIFTQKFVATLLGMAEGLEEEQKNIFEKTWLDMIAEQQSRQLKTSQGVQARSVL